MIIRCISLFRNKNEVDFSGIVYLQPVMEIIIVKEAIRNGNLSILKQYHQKYGNQLRKEIDHKACGDAAKNGHLNCLKYLIENKFHHFYEDELDAGEILLSENSAIVLCDVLCDAAFGGSIPCLQYLFNAFDITKINKTTDESLHICREAVNAGLYCLRYVHQHGCIINSWVAYLACEKGDLDCLVYATVNGGLENDEDHLLSRNICSSPTDEDHCVLIAAAKGHLSCLQYLLDEKPYADPHNLICTYSANDIDCLTYAHTAGYKIGADVLYIALSRGNLECLTYAHENGARVELDVANGPALLDIILVLCEAVDGVHLKCLSYFVNECGGLAQSRKAKSTY
jgi:hypothetical protein